MQPLVIGGAAGVAGLVVGYLIGYMSLKGKTTAAEGELAKVRDDIKKAKQEASKALGEERARREVAEKNFAQAQENLASLGQQGEQRGAQLQKVQTALKEAEAAREKAGELAETHKKAWAQAEGRAKQFETAATQAQQQAQGIEAQARSALAERDALKVEVDRRSQEIQRLRKAGPSKPSADETTNVFAQAQGSLEGILKILVSTEGQTAAVLADANGIVVAAAGDAGLKEGMAATTRLVGSIAKQLEGMVPFTTVRQFSLQDTESNVISGRSFACAGETVGLATYGSHVPADRTLEGAVANLVAVLA